MEGMLSDADPEQKGETKKSSVSSKNGESSSKASEKESSSTKITDGTEKETEKEEVTAEKEDILQTGPTTDSVSQSDESSESDSSAETASMEASAVSEPPTESKPVDDTELRGSGDPNESTPPVETEEKKLEDQTPVEIGEGSQKLEAAVGEESVTKDPAKPPETVTVTETEDEVDGETQKLGAAVEEESVNKDHAKPPETVTFTKTEDKVEEETPKLETVSKDETVTIATATPPESKEVTIDDGVIERNESSNAPVQEHGDPIERNMEKGESTIENVDHKTDAPIVETEEGLPTPETVVQSQAEIDYWSDDEQQKNNDDSGVSVPDDPKNETGETASKRIVGDGAMTNVEQDEPPVEGEANLDEDIGLEEDLDFDQDKGNPQYIPKKGAFYEHDDRRGTDDEAEVEQQELKEDEAEVANGSSKDSPEHRRAQRVLQSETKDRWEHDLFESEEQAPKSQGELVTQYGYDIRDESSAPRAARRRKYGRGPNKYVRDWKDERAYQGRTHNAQQERRNAKEFNPRREDFPCLPEQSNPQQRNESAPHTEKQSQPQRASHDNRDQETDRRSENRRPEPPRKQDSRKDQRKQFENNRNQGSDYGRDSQRRPQQNRDGWDQRNPRDNRDNRDRRDQRDIKDSRNYQNSTESYRDPRNNENWRASRDNPRNNRESGMRPDPGKRIGSGRTLPEQRGRRNESMTDGGSDRRNYEEKKPTNTSANGAVESKRYTAQRAVLRGEYPTEIPNSGNPQREPNVPQQAPKGQPSSINGSAQPAVPLQQSSQQYFEMARPYYVQPYEGGVPPQAGPQNYMQPYMNQPPPFLTQQAAAQYIIGAPEGPVPAEVYPGGAPNGGSGITYFHPHTQQMYVAPPVNPPHQRPKAIIPITAPPDTSAQMPGAQHNSVEA